MVLAAPVAGSIATSKKRGFSLLPLLLTQLVGHDAVGAASIFKSLASSGAITGLHSSCGGLELVAHVVHGMNEGLRVLGLLLLNGAVGATGDAVHVVALDDAAVAVVSQ